MRWAVSIAVVLLVATGADAIAETCSIPTDDEVEARTAKCLLSIDGKRLVNERCDIRVSPDGRGFELSAGKYYVEVSVTLDRRNLPIFVIAKWNLGSGRSDQLTSLGTVNELDRSGARCFRNRRIEMCASEYLTCKCGPDEYDGCKRANTD